MISYIELLEVFFATHDPTTLNRQGHDIGTQYRSAIFYNSEQQKEEALGFIQFLENEKVFENKVVTEVTALGPFYIAEAEHQTFYDRNREASYCQFVIDPKITKLKTYYSNKLKENSSKNAL